MVSSILNTSKHFSGLFKPGNPGPSELAELFVQDHEGKQIRLCELWSDYPVLLKVIPKMESKAFRQEAKGLNELQHQYKDLKIVAIVQEKIDLTTFLDCSCWSWQVYKDPTWKIFQWAGISYENKPFSLRNILNRNSQKEGIGGTFIISTKGNILYSFLPSRSAPFPSIKSMLSCLGGNPEDIDDFIISSQRPMSLDNFSKKYVVN